MITILFLLAARPASAVEQGNDASGATGEAAAEEPKRKPTVEELTADTLPMDIETASYYELFTWCRSLGLDFGGGRKELQDRLRSFYKIGLTADTPIASEAGGPSAGAGAAKDGNLEGAKGRKITVKSAKTSQYFTEKETGEKYVHLTGDIHVEVKDEKSGSMHIVKAQSLTYNMTRNMVTAHGEVEYTLDKGTSKEVFRGASLTFNLDTWEGVFYDGETSQKKTVDGKEIEFHFKGKVTSRLANDTVILEEGSFTSCEDTENPHWSMDSWRIWLLAPGEWALTSSVLKVGRVPLFYFPFFFMPGDEILFYPTIGFTAREGAHLQTTTYLLGRKKSEDTSLSFLKLSEAADTEYSLVPWGIFLRKVSGASEKSADANYLKLMLDAYSNLGVFAGLAGEFSPWETFYGGLAFSRSIFTGTDSTTGSTTYTTLYTESDGTVSTYLNSTNLFGITLPFRFGLENDLKLSGDFYGLTSHIEYYSDPSFNTDFYDRSEGIDWASLLSESTTTELTENTSFTWDLSGRLNLPSSVKIPLIQSLALQYFNVKLSWLSKLTSPTPTAPESSDPGRYFFYPVLLTVPSTSVTVSGELLRLSSSPATEAAAATGKGASAPAAVFPGKGLRQPEGLPEPLEKPGTAAKEAVPGPQRKKDDVVPSEQAASSIALSYQVQPTAVVENTFDNTAWTKQSKVDFKALYTTAQVSATSSMKAALSLLGGLFDTSATVSLDGTARTRFNRSDTVTDATWNTLLANDIAQNKYDVKTVVAATLRPLKDLPDWSASNIAYNLSWRAYRWQQDSDLTAVTFTETGPLWDSTTVTAHSLQTTLQTKLLDLPQSLSFSAQLPPLSPVLYSGSFSFAAWLFTTGLSTSLKDVDDVWTWQPLVASEKFILDKNLSLSEELQYSFEDQEFSKSTSTLKLWDLSAVFLAKTMNPTDPLGDTVSGSTEALLPYNLAVNYDLATDPLYFWKNRIKLQPTVKAGWTINPMAYTDNSFTFSTTTTLSISKFLDFSFTSYSTNTKTYRYFPGLAEEVGEVWVNPLVDLLKSFNFFSEADRKASAFKIRSLSISAIHYLHDWNLSLTYEGDWETHSIYSSAKAKYVKEYYWAPTFTIKLQWIPVQEIKSTITGDYEGVSLRG